MTIQFEFKHDMHLLILSSISYQNTNVLVTAWVITQQNYTITQVLK